MSDQRLTNLAVLSIEQDLSDKFVDDFAHVYHALIN